MQTSWRQSLYALRSGIWMASQAHMPSIGCGTIGVDGEEFRGKYHEKLFVEGDDNARWSHPDLDSNFVLCGEERGIGNAGHPWPP